MIIEKHSRTYAWFHDVTTLDIEVSRGEGIGAHKVLSGSPIDENGNIANDETAIGLLMETVSDANPDGKIVVAGDVDALGAKNASGIELSDAAKNALSGITWRDPDYVVEMQSGGGWPSDLPKPSVGGYGYTEQGEQTVIVDNESVTTVAAGGMNYGQFTTPFDIVDGAYTVIFNGTEYNLNSTLNEEMGGYFIGEITETEYDFSRYPFIIANMSGMTILLTQSAGDYEITVKAPTDIIHKIDEKYLNVTETAVLSTNAGRMEIREVFEKFYSCYKEGFVPRLGIYDEEYPENINYYDCECVEDVHDTGSCSFHFSKTDIMIGQMQIVSIRLHRNDLEVKEHWITL